MITEARKKNIVELIEKQGIVTLQQLSDTFGVSIYTIRRDLTTLEKKGLIQKTHGGATKIEKSKWLPSFQEGSLEAIEQKKAIAFKASELVESGDTIFLMGSMISLLMIPLIKDLHITIVTNSLDVAKELSVINNIETILIGGKIKNEKGNILGSTAIQQLSNFHLDKAFIPCAGIHHDIGISTSTIDSSAFLKTLISCSRQNIVVADYRKFRRITFAKVCNFEKIHIIITDTKANKDELKRLEENHVHIDVAHM